MLRTFYVLVIETAVITFIDFVSPFFQQKQKVRYVRVPSVESPRRSTIRRKRGGTGER